jgi:hypothetical protein
MRNSEPIVVKLNRSDSFSAPVFALFAPVPIGVVDDPVTDFSPLHRI